MKEKRPPHTRDGLDVRVLDLLAVPVRHWRIVAYTLAVAVAVVLVLTIVLPPTYIARTVVVPNEEESGLGTLAALAGDLPLNFGMLQERSTEEKVIDAILGSRSLADSIIQQEDLVELWGVHDVAAARKRLGNETMVLEESEGAIAIEVKDPDPELAVRIANAYPVHLNEISARLETGFARQRGAFLERQLAESRVELEQAEERLVEFERAKGLPQVEEQARQTVEAAAELQALIFRKELELAQLRRFTTPSNPRYAAAAAELATLNEQLDRLTAGGSRREELFVPLRQAPELGIEYLRLYRDFKEREEVYGVLTAGLAQARIEAGRALPVVSVLDPAVEPDDRAGMGILVRLAVAMFIGVGAGVFIALALEWWRAARLDPGNDRFFGALDALREDVRRFRRG